MDKELDKENSACNLPTLTPSKCDPGHYVLGQQQGARGLVGSEPCSPPSPRDDGGREAPRVVHLNPIASMGGGRTPREDLAELARLVSELQQQLAAAQQPVVLSITVLDHADAAALQRSEGMRQELAKVAGHLKGRVAKLEGAVAAGEIKVRAQGVELDALKSANRDLELRLWQAQQQIGTTPERVRTALREVQDKAGRAEDTVAHQAHRISRLQSVVEYDGGERQELAAFTALEYELSAAEEVGLLQKVEQLSVACTQAAQELANVRGELAEARVALQQGSAEVGLLQRQVEELQGALAAAITQGGEWRHKAEQYERDRQQAAANVRKAEREVDLIAQENAVMFRQVNFVRTRLLAHMPLLERAVPDIAKLARELQAWCDKEAGQRARGSGLTPWNTH